MSEKTEKRIRIMCKRDIANSTRNKNNLNYKSIPYNIPIAKDGESYITGQNLTLKQMTGEEALTPEEKKLYPFIVNPFKMYKIRHLTWLSYGDANQKAMIDLLLTTGRWAENKIIYNENPVQYDGYFEDPISEAKVDLNFKDDRFDAESSVRNANIDDYEKIALMLNFLAPDVNININLAKDLVLKQLFDVCDVSPKIVKQCFVKYNKGVDKDIFLLECIHYEILQRKDNGDIWYQNDFIGKTLDDVKRFLSKKENDPLHVKFQVQLNEKKGFTVSTIQKDPSGADRGHLIVMECKTAIFDKDYDKAMHYLGMINQTEFKDAYEQCKQELENVKTARESSKSNVKKEKFMVELNSKTLTDLQKTIRLKTSNYKEEDYKEVWEDKDALVVAMTKFKFGE